tara:strand:- start:32330 stop:33055 length:726 start_codon:yes stop_codon:yes gene_type:complete
VQHENEKKTEVDSGITSGNAGWTFDVPPAEFENHIEKSVPFYKEGHELIAQISDFFLPENALVYDIGTTTGAIPRKILSRHPEKNVRIIGLDVVDSMIGYARQSTNDPRATFICENALEHEFDNANLVIMYYTQQFIHPSVRIDLLKKIYNSLAWGGGLLVFEKVRAPDARFQDYMSQLYIEFKLDNEFSADQILNKQRSLKGVLEPFSELGNRTLFEEAGFRDILTVFKYICFEGWLLIK